MPLRTLKCSVSECTRFCTPCRFHFRVQAKMPILKRKCTKSVCTLKCIQKRKSLKRPANKDFSGKKEDTDIVSISASFVGRAGGARTRTNKSSSDFKSEVSAIPPQPRIRIIIPQFSSKCKKKQAGHRRKVLHRKPIRQAEPRPLHHALFTSDTASPVPADEA